MCNFCEPTIPIQQYLLLFSYLSLIKSFLDYIIRICTYKIYRQKYNNSTAFYMDYFGGNIETLVSSIKKYKHSHKAHKSDELYLADLLK